MVNKNVKSVPITNLTIRLSGSNDDRCCFDVLANGLQLAEHLTFGELIEYLVTVFRFNIHGVCYTSDYPKITLNDSL